MSCGVDVSPVWEVELCDDTSARNITAISSIIRLTIVINSRMMVLVIIIISSVIKDITLIVTRKMQLVVLSL